MARPATQEIQVTSSRPPKRETREARNANKATQKTAKARKVKEPHRNDRCNPTKPK